ncbi:RagB/SusD family nutrient uptake outer membrane protein [Chitinophaga qingshengii]|uniref:RagB/SusD family nutrient uptake outer membrane protein n=1 Tax=Chitinophaga qingshengii TaxID=1569794 RepID=A0ABR7TV45_9BACT|nr:RagB/SusD family nutrient uptake outer membrane protein [Chitinophaga qingshengii]MBC9932829.1 RagB/SusD family nutrient uptake outer membrane protein [Chitinophaga qingshengii]
MKKLFIVIIGALCMTSCKKFLQEYSQSDITPKTTKDYEALLLTEGYPRGGVDLQPWMVFLDDDTQCYYGPSIANLSLPPLVAGVFQWQTQFANLLTAAGFPGNINAWGNYYKLLLGVNLAIENADNSQGDPVEKDLLKGEAFLLRAFYHFTLVNIYAKPYNDSLTTPDKSLGVPIRTTAGLTDKYLARNTVKEVYDQVEKDLDSAIYLLDKRNKKMEQFRISPAAAHLLASRVYLYMEKWDKCIEHADKVILLHPQLMNLNSWGGAPDPDGKPLVGFDNVETIWAYGSPREQTIMPYILAYDISHDLVNTFEDDDLRKATGFYINTPADKIMFAPDFSQMKNLDQRNGKNIYGTNSWRSAEAYLNRAEAYIQLYRTKGDATAAAEALKSLNTLRSNRMDASSFREWSLRPGAELLQMCRDERRRELYREELHRWFDLRRYGMPSITHSYTPDQTTTQIFRLPARDPMYVIPIPDDVLSRNPGLVQNPLFSGTRMPQ